MKFTPMQCPTCGRQAIGTVDTIPSIALFTVFDDGVEFSGTTKVFWDGQISEEKDGKVLLQCPNDHTWLAEMDADHECEGCDRYIIAPKAIVAKAL